ncbi:MAG: thioredoxin domain-containing protein [Candidatus Zixiibacteriota bacterium]
MKDSTGRVSDTSKVDDTVGGTAYAGHANALINEKSPYLLQHAYNPLEWYPWGEEAFDKARREDKPIFLSIGYSTCHWCHVMEHESFEDSAVAAMMNDAFVSIKVDREERPDIDNIYMTVCQMMTGSGGWPLTILMTPDKKPFFAGTYIPRESLYGRPGMLELIPQVVDVWKNRREDIDQSAEQIVASLQRSTESASSGGDLGETTLVRAYDELKGRFDEQRGGFAGSRKFPIPHNQLFLLRYWKRTGDQHALAMVEKTLQAMRRGGTFDHVGFGFHRYSTDPDWLLPHFEKMLYDQALLTMAYVEAYQVTGKDEYATTAREILTYVLRDMTSPDGGFYSAEDADSEGEEGKYYVWTLDELKQVLGEEDARIATATYNVLPNGNFKDEATGAGSGANILHLTRPLSEVASELALSESELDSKLESTRERLFAYREKRVHPSKDDKILTDWNGLMIASLAKAAQVFDDPQYRDAAEKAAEFVMSNVRSGDGRLLHRFRDGEAAMPAFVDDYAYFVWGLLELYEATFDTEYLKSTIELNDQMLAHFWDDTDGGYFFTADDSEELIHRSKEIYDGATPSGNSVAMLNLLRLARITGDTALESKAAAIAKSFSGSVNTSPSNFTQLMMAVDFAVGPSYEIVIVGKDGAEDTEKMLSTLQSVYLPNKVVIFKPSDEKSPDISKIAEFTRDQKSIDAKSTVYVCMNYNCKLPTTSPDEMITLLKQ